MSFTTTANKIFSQSINDYHKYDSIDQPMSNPFPDGSIEFLLYSKNWIDNIQWHYEDIIRNPNIDPKDALVLKRRIDTDNQRRTDMVEYIDSYFLDKFKGITPLPNARINTETIAWAIDRLSILSLKIYHMHEETVRTDVNAEHIANCQKKLDILLTQQKDLSQSIEELLADIEGGKCLMKVYRQMKMYNDPSLNPVLYGKQ